MFVKRMKAGNFLAVQWLRLHTSNAGDKGSIPKQGTKIPHAMHYGQKKKKTPGTKSLCTPNCIFVTF